MADGTTIVIVLLVIAAIVVIFMLASPCQKSGYQRMVEHHTMNLSASQQSLSNMQKLWSEHVFWTRLFIVASLYNLPTVATDTQRLLSNQSDIAQALGQQYGSQFAAAAEKLLDEHIQIAAKLVNAAKNNQPLDQLMKDWQNNADQIATALNSVNPQKFPLDGAKSMMREHLMLTTNELTDLLKGNYSAATHDMDQIHTQALNMAMMMA